jgi:hypothetical protein
MNSAEIEQFKRAIKRRIKKKFSGQEIMLLMLMFDVLIAARRKQAVSASAHRYQFEFAIKACERYKVFTSAITLLERLITE